MSQKFISTETPVQNLQYSKAWTFLTEKEKNYAYFISKASWAGAKMVFHQISYEAPALFLVFQAFFQEKDFYKVEHAALAAGVSAEDYNKFVAYAAGIYGNMSNYHNFGDLKFIPDLSAETFTAILKSNPLYQDNDIFYKEAIDTLLPEVLDVIFKIDKPYTQLNFPEEGGITAYFSRNMTKTDLALVDKFAAAQGIDILNTRAFKKDGKYILTVGSAKVESKTMEFEGSSFEIQYGEFSPYMEETVMYLKEALKYVANENQQKMVEKYIDHFGSGDITTHKESQRYWVQDKGPVVESNIGWVETYVDPANVRAYWEGWVAIVDKEKSKKFQALVTNSEAVIPLLPWPKTMEKDKFLAPDFTTLEIISMATNGCPLGINIPNYDDIRQDFGFKNVYLGNAMPNVKVSNVQFATPEQAKTMADNTMRCYEVHVACHELLGHGVGKLIYRNADGTCEKYTDPLNGEEFESCYEEGEVWNTKFGAISTSYEECRADTCGFYLCTLKEVYELFGFEDHEVDTMLWVNVMSQLRKGILGLPLFNPETNKWGQAHTQGAFVFTMWILKNQKSKIVDIELKDDEFFIHLDQALLVTEGKELIRQLLMVLQTYKSSGAAERGTKWYNDYSAVGDMFLKIREIVIAKKKPRRLDLNNNLVRFSEKSIEPVCYPENFQGVILSYADRFTFNKKLFDQVKGVWDQHKECLRVQE